MLILILTETMICYYPKLRSKLLYLLESLGLGLVQILQLGLTLPSDHFFFYRAGLQKSAAMILLNGS